MAELRDCPRFDWEGRAMPPRKVRETLCRRKIDLLHHVLVGKPLVENRVQPLFDKRQEAGAVFRERLGKALRRELFSMSRILILPFLHLNSHFQASFFEYAAVSDSACPVLSSVSSLMRPGVLALTASANALTRTAGM